MGRTRKPTELHLVENTLNVTKHKGREEEPKPKGSPVKPPGLFPRESKVWCEVVAIAYWLTEADSEILSVYCQITANEARRHTEIVDRKKKRVGGVSSMDAARIAQWRMLAQELGLTPASRSKINVGTAIGKEAGKKVSDKFYA